MKPIKQKTDWDLKLKLVREISEAMAYEYSEYDAMNNNDTPEDIAVNLLDKFLSTQRQQLMKTKSNWYPDQPMGSYYKLEDGILLFSPMLEDGTRAEEDGVVDFGFLEEENEDLKNGENIVEHLNKIIKSLIIKE